MKRVEVTATISIPTGKQSSRRYLAGKTYDRVLEAHAAEIEKAGAGRIIGEAGESPAAEHGDQTAETNQRPRRRAS